MGLEMNQYTVYLFHSMIWLLMYWYSHPSMSDSSGMCRQYIPLIHNLVRIAIIFKVHNHLRNCSKTCLPIIRLNWWFRQSYAQSTILAYISGYMCECYELLSMSDPNQHTIALGIRLHQLIANEVTMWYWCLEVWNITPSFRWDNSHEACLL